MSPSTRSSTSPRRSSRKPERKKYYRAPVYSTPQRYDIIKGTRVGNKGVARKTSSPLKDQHKVVVSGIENIWLAVKDTEMENEIINILYSKLLPLTDIPGEPCKATSFGKQEGPRLTQSYIKINKQHKKVKYQVNAHQVVYAKKRLDKGKRWKFDFKKVVSHRCHQKFCCGKKCMTLEDDLGNISRKMDCFDYSECAKCKSKHPMCCHSPKCNRKMIVLCSKCTL